jgi:hypothetical protein
VVSGTIASGQASGGTEILWTRMAKRVREAVREKRLLGGSTLRGKRIQIVDQH